MRIHKIVKRLIDQDYITENEGEAILECFWMGAEGVEDNELVPEEVKEGIESLIQVNE